MRHIRTREIKARAEELLEGYQEARDEEFDIQFSQFMRDTLKDNDIITEDDVQGFLDSFDFPDEDTWSFDAVQSELDDIGDQQMELARDREMGL